MNKIEYFNLIYIALAVIAVIAGLIVAQIQAGRKLEQKLRDSFGNPPEMSDYYLGSIETYYKYKSANSDTSRYIDDITWNDLEMDKVFMRINSCHTSVGEEYLYNCLREPQFDETPLLLRESFIGRLGEMPEERLKIQICLAKLGKLPYNGVPDLIYSSGRLLKFPTMYHVLSVIPLVCAAAMFINFSAGIISLVVSFIINTAVYLRTKRRIETSLPLIRYFSAMVTCCGRLLKIQSFQSEAFITQLQQLYRTFKPLMSKGSEISQKHGDITEMFLIYWNILFLADIKKYNKIISGISKHKYEFHDLYKTLGEIDLSVNVLSLRHSLPFYTKPVFHETNSIKYDEIYHIMISSPVPNSGEINRNSIITGSNASGKSTFIKTLAINGILAQTIYTCTANVFATRFSLVMTSMALRDDISEEESYFITEIKSLKRIIDKIKIVYCTCFIDEILRGTNTTERIAASASVLNYLGGKDCLCVAASHDIELAKMLQDKLDNFHFRERITDDGMVFDYKIKQGISNTRNAIKLLRYMGFESEIVENAETLADK